MQHAGPGPEGINWDITYACPLRCGHCYSESGRRAPRTVALDTMLRIADALVSLKPKSIHISGGEPLAAKGLLAVAERIAASGIELVLYTSGWSMPQALVPEIVRLFSSVHVSLDGATAAVHDRLRGRNGAFDRAMDTLTRLDRAVRQAPLDGTRFEFGIDIGVMRDNAAQMAQFCTDLAPRFPALSFLMFGMVVPAGLASRSGFADTQLLDAAAMRALADPALAGRLTALAPASVRVGVTDNRDLMMHPDDLAAGRCVNSLMHVEPDGAVRGMPVYEGCVGNVLHEPAAAVWQRTFERCAHPFVVQTLASVRSAQQWALAARKIDRYFGTAQDLLRFSQRPAYVPLWTAG